MTQERLRILTKAEINSLYGCPQFSDDERQYYFSLNDAETQAMMTFGSVATKAYFIAQLGYFKATSLFFPDAFIAEDLSFVVKTCFPKKTLPPAVIPSEKTRNKIHNAILKITGFDTSKETICQSIQSMLPDKIRINSHPIYLFHEILMHLQENNMRLLGYSTLQGLITEALAHEEKRLQGAVGQAVTPLVSEQLENLLSAENVLYRLTALKKDPKNFRTKHIKIEIKKLNDNKVLYQFAAHFLPTLRISKQTMAYYAFLAQHYSVYRLSKLPQAVRQLYLLCFVFLKYQHINDHLIINFMCLVKKYYDKARAAAKDSIFNENLPASEDPKQAAKILAFFTDKDIEDETVFGELRKAAFTLLARNKFPAVIQFMAGILCDIEQARWDELAKLKASITANLRPIFSALDFKSTNTPLLEAIQFLKEVRPPFVLKVTNLSNY